MTGALQYSTLLSGLAGAEGPLALSDGTLLCVETMGGALVRIGPGGAVGRIMLGKGPNGLAIGPDGRCYVCNNGGITEEDVKRLQSGIAGGDSRPPQGCIQAVDLVTGAFETLYERCDDSPLVAPNDIAFDAEGGFYFTDYGSLHHPGPLPGQLYYARPDGSDIRLEVAGLERPNGVGLSPDGGWLYVSESLSGRVWRLSILAPGHVAPLEKPLFEAPGLPLDSLAMQQDGGVCVAAPLDDMILRIAVNGTVEKIATPAGGPDNRTAYVTLIFSGELVTTQWDAAGLRLPHSA